MPEVLNARVVGTSRPGAVYCGRPSVWGNPFPAKDGITRSDAIQRFEIWFMAQPELIARAKRELKGKDLICWCAPKRCHCDILLREANSILDDLFN